MDFKKFFKDEAYSWMYKTLAFGLAAAMLFTAGVFSTSLFTPKRAATVHTQSAQSISSSADTSDSTAQKTPQSSSSSLSSSNTESTITEDTKSEMSTAEIIDLFNESANKIKTDATKVTKNYEDRTHMEEYLVLPKALTSIAADLMNDAFKDDTVPIDYTTKEDIIANFQVPGETWVSQLTEAEVEEAKCVDNGTEYELYIKALPSINPEPGNGVAKAFDTITSSEIMEKAPSMVKDFTTEYFDCIIRCKINKDTKQITWINYSSPLILKLKVEFFGTLDAQVGLKFEKDYTITY